VYLTVSLLVLSLGLLGGTSGAVPPNYEDQVPAGSAVIPGTSMGMVRLGMTAADADLVLGVPDLGVKASATNQHLWQPDSPPGGPLMAVTDRNGRIVKMKTYWNIFYRTARGLHVGLSEGDARRIGGEPLRTAGWSHYRLIYYLGLILIVDTDTTIVFGLAVVPS